VAGASLVNKRFITQLKIFGKNATIMDWKKRHNSDWEPTRCRLMSEVKQTQRERELEEKDKESFLFKASSSTGKSYNL